MKLLLALGPLFRFVLGGLIGLYVVALFGSNAYAAVLAFVFFGVAMDKLLPKLINYLTS